MNELSWVFGCFAATSATHKNGQMSCGRRVSIEPKLLIVQIYTLHTCFISRFPMKDWPIWTFIYPVVLRGKRGKRGGELQSIHKYRNVPYFLEASVQLCAANMKSYFQTLPTYSCKSEWLAFQSWNDMHGLSPVRLADCMPQLRAVLRQCPTRREASGAKQRDKCPPELL